MIACPLCGTTANREMASTDGTCKDSGGCFERITKAARKPQASVTWQGKPFSKRDAARAFKALDEQIFSPWPGRVLSDDFKRAMAAHGYVFRDDGRIEPPDGD